jgi:hypothetical protein
MTKTSKPLALIGLSLCVSLSAFHAATAANKASPQPSKAQPAKISPAKIKPVEIKTYTITGHADATPVDAAKSTAPAKAMMPQELARRFGLGRFGPGGRPGILGMPLGVGPGRP